MIIYLLGAFLLSMVCGFVFTPIILDFCKRKGLYDIPNERKMHKSAIPRLGGVSFLPCMGIAFVVVMLMMNPSISGKDTSISLWSAYFCISLAIIYLTGMIDDLIGLNAKIKFTTQIIAASLMPMAGLCINNLYGLFGIYEIPYWINAPLTVFVMVFIMNAINLIDGIDGLAASLSLMALGGFLIAFIREGLPVYCTLIAGLMGTLIPYLYYNLLGDSKKNRKIFMGDSGSLTLGFILSFLFVKFASYNPKVMEFHMDGLLIPYTLLIVPMLDVIRVILYRLRHHSPLFDADKNHIHHKLMRTGLSQHQTLLFIIALSTSYIFINLLLFKVIGLTSIVLIDIIIYTLANIFINVMIQHQEKRVYPNE